MFSQVEEIIKSWFLIDVIALSYERTDERHDKVLIRFLDTPIQYLIFFNENVQTTKLGKLQEPITGTNSV